MPLKSRAEALMKSFVRACATCTVLVVIALSCTGCLRPPDSNRSAISNDVHSKDYYEGYWICTSYEEDGETISLESLPAESRKEFPHFDLTINADYTATLWEIGGDDGTFDVNLSGEWKAVSEGVVIDEYLFPLVDDNLTCQSGDRELYFTKCIDGNQLLTDTFTFEDISFDAPLDLAYAQEGMKPESEDYGAPVSHRRDGPTLFVASMPVEIQDITEMPMDQFSYAGYEGRFETHDGITFYLMTGIQQHDSAGDYETSMVYFIANNKLYGIQFNHFDQDPVDYSDYVNSFYTTIKIREGNSSSDTAETMPEGAIPWQDATQYIGELATVYGPVADIDYATESDGQPTFIDLGVAYPDSRRVTIVIWGEDRNAFPEAPESMYAGKTLGVTGEIYEYKGVCNIKVESPSQISVL